MIIYWAKT